MKNKYVDLEVLNHGLKELATKINSVFRKIKDSYTKTEIDDKFTSMAKGMNWKPSVATKVDLEALTDNSKSDTRIVEDESKIYMYNGTSWEGIGSSANVPKATIDNDGLMSKEDFTKLEGIEPDKYETKEDFNTKVGSLTSLNTDNKDSVVSAINEVKEGVNNTVKIDDTVVDTNKVYSSKKIDDTYVQKEKNKSLVLDSEIEKIHKHENIDSLNKISEDENGNPLFNGKLIQAEKEIWTGTKEEYNAITDKKDDITYIVTDEEDNLDINSLVIDDTKTSDKTTWSSKKINEENKEIYSTDEVKTNKVWIDGKPIYRKVVTQTITTPGSENIINNFDISLIRDIISIYGSIKQPSGTIAPISYHDSSSDGAFICMSKRLGHFIFNAKTAGVGDVILIVEYTKTID